MLCLLAGLLAAAVVVVEVLAVESFEGAGLGWVPQVLLVTVGDLGGAWVEAATASLW